MTEMSGGPRNRKSAGMRPGFRTLTGSREPQVLLRSATSSKVDRMETPAWDHKELTVGELASRSGVAVSALHFYERKGLISSRRTSGNQRRYPRAMLRRVALIRIAQRVGVPLAEIKKALDTLPDDRAPNRRDWERLSQAWRDELDQRIRLLQQIRDDFTDCIGCGCLSLDRCALANTHDRLAEYGTGPRRLVDD